MIFAAVLVYSVIHGFDEFNLIGSVNVFFKHYQFVKSRDLKAMLIVVSCANNPMNLFLYDFPVKSFVLPSKYPKSSLLKGEVAVS